MSGDSVNDLLVTLGKAQVDAMFRRQDDYPVDDSEFLPLVEAALTAFETTGIDEAVAEAVWEHAFHVYDQACKEAPPRINDGRKRAAHAELPAGQTPQEPEAVTGHVGRKRPSDAGQGSVLVKRNRPQEC